MSHAVSGKFKIFSATMLAALVCSTAAPAADTLPQTMDECPLTQSDFNGWFQSGTAATNGIVNPANSITFNGVTNCDFYKWSEQMWLWASSPAPSGYGGGNGRVFQSSVFYNVSPPDPNNNLMRHMTANAVNIMPASTQAIRQAGREMLPVMQDTNGTLQEIMVAARAIDGNSMIRNDAGQMVEIGRIQATKGGKAVFYDVSDNKIRATVRPSFDLMPPSVTGPLNALAIAEAKTHGADKQVFRAQLIQNLLRDLASVPLVEKFTVSNVITFVTTFGTIAHAEVGQAGDEDVLITQAGQIVYYNVDVNDVYAYYLTGRKRTSPPLLTPGYTQPDGGSFPTSQAELTTIQNTFSKTFPDGTALAIELKTSWVKAASLPDPQDYILRTVNVPVYNTTLPDTWTQTGTQNVQMAMLGMHLVGSTAGHKEMIWGTYEHVNNSPHGSFNFLDPMGNQQFAGFNTGPNSPPWVLYDSSSGACPGLNCNVAQATLDTATGNIIGTPIGPSNVMRTMAFGAAFNQTPNPLVGAPGNSNDEVISLNNHVHSMLPGDVRSNYVFIGSTWTILGAVVGNRFVEVPPPPTGNQVGTNTLSDSSMESFLQGPFAVVGPPPNENPSPTNCLDCHKNAGTANSTPPVTFNTTDVSRIFNSISPLF